MEDDEDISVSSVLKWTNSIIYYNERNEEETGLKPSKSIKAVPENLNRITTDCVIPTPTHNNMDQSTPMPVQPGQNIANENTNNDIMHYLQGLGQMMKTVLEKVEKLDRLEARVVNFERECSKIWNYIYDHSKTVDDRLEKAEERSYNVDKLLGELSSRVLKLEEEKRYLKDELIYLQSQSMKNNLVFANIPECPKDKEENSENLLRSFLIDKLKLAEDIVKQLQFDRVHRVGQRRDDTNRRIVARFTTYKDREIVRREKRVLDGTPYHLHEQFPKEIAEKRRRLWPQMKEAIDANKQVWMSYDTLFIDGRPVKVPCE